MGLSVVSKGLSKGVNAAGAGVTKGADTVKKGVLAPLTAFLQKIWYWLKYVCSLSCCCCVVSLCMAFGVPQMIASALDG